MTAVCFYISGHGFGHASREIEVINALGRLLPPAGNIEIVVRTSAPSWLFEQTVRTPYTFLQGVTDTGIVQVDSLRLDEDATVRQAGEFYASLAQRSMDEARVLREHDVRLVIADAPPLACAAAARAGVPSVVLGNFTWDWIYEGYQATFSSRAPDVLPAIREAYSSAVEGWRLPLHGGFGPIESVIDLPYVARHARHPREHVLKTLGVSADRPLALSSFGGYGVRDLDPGALDCLNIWTVIITGRHEPDTPLPTGAVFVEERRMYEAGLRYEDLVAAVDVVVSKPGYGIVSECIANNTAMLYTSRGHFVEYDVMIREMPAVLRCRYLDQESLLGGVWLDALEELLSSPPAPERPGTNGAQIAAAEILRRLRLT